MPLMRKMPPGPWRRPWVLLLVFLAITGPACAPFNPEAAVIPAQVITPPQALNPGNSQRLAGQALIGREALANAEVKVLDAANGSSIAVQPGALAGYGLRQSSFKTDAAGNFAFQMPTPRRGDVYRIVVSDGRRTITTLIGVVSNEQNDRDALAFQSLDNRPTSSTRTDAFSFAVTPATTLADSSVKSLIPLAKTLTAEAESRLFLEMLNSGQNFAEQISRTFTTNEFSALVESTDANSGVLEPKTLSEAMGRAGLERLFRQTVAESIQLLSQLRSVASNVDPGADTEVAPDELEALASAGFDVSVEGTTINISGNGLDVGFDIGTETPPPSDPGPTPAPSTDTSPASPQDETAFEDINSARPGFPIGTNTNAFRPLVTLNMNTSSRALQLSVSQAAGQEDVEFIVARISKTLTGAAFFPPTTLLASGTSTAPLAAGVHRVEKGGSPRSLPLSLRMGGGKLENAAFVGQWRYAGRSANIADVQVFDVPSFIYVTLAYALNDSVRLNLGHTTTMTLLPSVLQVDSAKVTTNRDSQVANVDIDIYSRRGNLMEYSENLAVTP